MYRSLLKRLLLLPSYRNNVNRCLASYTAIPTSSSRLFTDSATQSVSQQNANQQPQYQQQQPSQKPPESLDSASASAATTAAEEEASRHESQSSREERQRRVEYQDEQARVLQAALRHVVRLGWTEAAMITGAKEVGVSPSIVGSFPRKEAALVEVAPTFFIPQCGPSLYAFSCVFC